MSSTTSNLGLFEYNTQTDGKQKFNIDNALNGNFDIIDAAVGKLTNLTTTQKSSLVSAICELVTSLDGKTSKSLDDLNAVGQALLDKKVEVEALLQQNGYAKFSWKENNQISSLIVQWLETTVTAKSNATNNISQYMTAFNLPIALTTFGKTYVSSATGSVSNGFGWNDLTQVVVGAVSRTNQDIADQVHYAFVIGY